MTTIELPTDGAPALYVTNRFADVAHEQDVNLLTPDPERIQAVVNLGANVSNEYGIRVGAIVLSTRSGYLDNSTDTLHALEPGQVVHEAKASAPVGRAALMAAGRTQEAEVLTVFASTVTPQRLASGLYSAASRLSDRGQSPLDNMSGQLDRKVGTIFGIGIGSLGEALHDLAGTPSIAKHLPYVDGAATGLIAGALGGALVGRYAFSTLAHLRRRAVDIDSLMEAGNPPIRVNDDGPIERRPADYHEPPRERMRPLRPVDDDYPVDLDGPAID